MNSKTNNTKEDSPKKDKNKFFTPGLIVHYLMFAALCFSIYTNIRLTTGQQEWVESNRKHQIAPNIQFVGGTGWKGSDSFNLRFKNIGNGIAQDIFLFISYLDNFHSVVIRDFHPLDPSKPTQSYIEPGEILECQVDLVNILQDENKEGWPSRLRMTCSFYFSYFDSGGNEHLMIATFPPSAYSGPLTFMTQEAPLNDYLLNLSKSVPRFTKREFKGADIRNKYKYVKEELVPPIEENDQSE